MTSPVSGSISTAQRWVPKGKVSPEGLKSTSAASASAAPSGAPGAWAKAASSLQPTARAGEPATKKRPSSWVTSCFEIQKSETWTAWIGFSCAGPRCEPMKKTPPWISTISGVGRSVWARAEVAAAWVRSAVSERTNGVRIMVPPGRWPIADAARGGTTPAVMVPAAGSPQMARLPSIGATRCGATIKMRRHPPSARNEGRAPGCRGSRPDRSRARWALPAGGDSGRGSPAGSRGHSSPSRRRARASASSPDAPGRSVRAARRAPGSPREGRARIPTRAGSGRSRSRRWRKSLARRRGAKRRRGGVRGGVLPLRESGRNGSRKRFGPPRRQPAARFVANGRNGRLGATPAGCAIRPTAETPTGCATTP